MAPGEAAARIGISGDHDRLLARPRAAAVAPRLLGVLERHTGWRGLAYAVPPTPLSGGFCAEIYAFRLRGAPLELSGDLVLRVMPDEQRALREAVIQGAASAAGFPTPRVVSERR